MSNLLAIVCTAAMIFSNSVNTVVGVNELKEDKAETKQEETVEIPKSKYDPGTSEPSDSEASKSAQTIIIEGDVYKDCNITNNNGDTTEAQKKDLNNNSDIMTARRERGILVLGDPANDINPQEDIICVEHIKCPECGECEYKETYNKNNINCYLGRCSACGYEQ